MEVDAVALPPNFTDETAEQRSGGDHDQTTRINKSFIGL